MPPKNAPQKGKRPRKAAALPRSTASGGAGLFPALAAPTTSSSEKLSRALPTKRRPLRPRSDIGGNKASPAIKEEALRSASAPGRAQNPGSGNPLLPAARAEGSPGSVCGINRAGSAGTTEGGLSSQGRAANRFFGGGGGGIDYDKDDDEHAFTVLEGSGARCEMVASPMYEGSHSSPDAGVGGAAVGDAASQADTGGGVGSGGGVDCGDDAAVTAGGGALRRKFAVAARAVVDEVHDASAAALPDGFDGDDDVCGDDDDGVGGGGGAGLKPPASSVASTCGAACSSPGLRGLLSPSLARTAAAALAASKKTKRKELLDSLDASELCRDMYGRRHVIKELRTARHTAVMRGMGWLFKFLTKDKHEALYAIGDDAPSVFFEIWYTSADSRIRCRAKGIAEALIVKYEASLLEGRQNLGVEQFFECMFLLRCKHEMELDTSALLKRADELFRTHGLRDTDALFGVTGGVEGLASVSVADWLLLLMRVMCLEYNNLLHRKRWPLRWGLLECFRALRRVPLTPPPVDDFADDDNRASFHDAFYLATHIVYAVGAYSVVKTVERDVPWLYKYCRMSLRMWLKRATKKDRLGGHDGGGRDVYVDVDGIAECADVLRGTGLTEASEPLLASASLWLMKTQRRNGSFPVWMSGGGTEHGFYDKLHPTWVSTQCLRDRDFEIGFTRPGNALWAAFMARTLAASNFKTVEYTTSYKRGVAFLNESRLPSPDEG